MIKEREILKVLFYIDRYGNSITADYFELEFVEFAKLLLYLKESGLIQGVEAYYADDTIYNLDIDNIRITLDGMEYLKKISNEINKNVLENLYENRFDKPLTVAIIKKSLFIHFKNIEVEAYLKLLKDRGFVKAEKQRIPAMKTGNQTIAPASMQERYRITDKGIQFVENDFKEEKRTYEPRTTLNINGGMVNFGIIHNLNYNYIDELKIAIPQSDIREEIERYFEEIKAVTDEENINKGKIITIFKKISSKLVEKGLDKSIDKVLEIGWMYIMAQMMK